MRTHRDIFAESDSMGELAEALLHRRAPEAPFMIVTAYMDESGTHGDSLVSVMAGYLANARQWQKFEKRAAKLFRRYRVDVCHAIDIKRGDGAFGGWSVDKKIEFIDELGHIKNETIELGLVCVLKDADYQEFYANRSRPRKVIKESKYTVLFRATFGGLMHGLANKSRFNDVNRNVRLHVVLEAGHANAGEVLKFYDFARSNLPQRAFAGISFQSKADCIPLAVCDMLAYGVYLVETGGKRIGDPRKPLKSSKSYRHDSTKKLRIGADGLNGLYLQSIQMYEERQKFGRRVSLSGNAA